ncbi:cmgc kinase [Paramyrothecium foliicola]|nr:cmgc kinase [Paramyrothecium foliicola]
MASPSAWKSSLSALDRYETIQKLQASLEGQSMSDAVAIEQAAYQSSTTHEEYLAACANTASTQRQSSPSPPPPTGIRIGSFTDCIPIGEGITSEVFRAGDKALKVIISRRGPIEPHNPQREARILQALRPPCIPLLDLFRDQEQRLVLVFPYMPFTLAGLLEKDSAFELSTVRTVFIDILNALEAIHSQGIIHRDIKPSAVLLESPTGPAYLSDFGTAWHPELSISSEPSTDKILDIGTGPYRAPEVLFGNKAYGPPVDMWGFGVMLSEAIRSPPLPVFESRPAHEDGSQLGLILSIFKTLGTPTPETWPEAKEFKITPFELWTVFPPRSWEEILPDVDSDFRDLVAALVRFDGSRATAAQALRFKCLTNA